MPTQSSFRSLLSWLNKQLQQYMIGQFERSKACFIIIHFTLNHKVSHMKWRLNYKSNKAKYADVVNPIATMQVNNATLGIFFLVFFFPGGGTVVGWL